MANLENPSGIGQAALVQLTDDMLDDVVGGTPGCGVLALMPGTYGPVVIEPKNPNDADDIGGDVYINGSLFYDCPAYEG